MEIKSHWLGHEWYLPAAAGNDINKVDLINLICALTNFLTQTNVPNIRLEYRHQTLLEEIETIRGKRKNIPENPDSYISDGAASKGTTGH